MEKVYLPDFLTVVYCYILWCNVAVEECVADDDMESANFYDCVDVDHVKDSYVKGEKENKRAIHEIIENEENLLNWHMIELEKLNEMGIIIHDQDFMERKKKMQYFCNRCISHCHWEKLLYGNTDNSLQQAIIGHLTAAYNSMGNR